MVKVMERKIRQRRMTHLDAKDSLRALKKFIKKKMKSNTPIKDDDQADYFIDIFDDSTLSHGAFPYKFYIRGECVIDFKNFGNFVESYVDITTGSKGNTVILVDETSGKEYEVEHRTIWRAMLNQINQLKPYVLDEAIRMSPETHVREARTSYTFSAKTHKEDEE